MVKRNHLIATTLVSITIPLVTSSSAYSIPILETIEEQLENVVEDVILSPPASSTPETQPSPTDSGVSIGNNAQVQQFDISGLRLYMTENEVLQIMEGLRSSQAGTSEIEMSTSVMCASDEANWNLARISGNPQPPEKNCSPGLRYTYSSPETEAGDYIITVSFIEDLPASPNTSVVSGISYRRVYPSAYPIENVHESVINRYGTPSRMTRMTDSNPVTRACWGNIQRCEEVGPSLLMDLQRHSRGPLDGSNHNGTHSLRLELNDDDFVGEKTQARVDYIDSLMQNNSPTVPDATF